jgi:predicted MFS family arabinose efflux permease
MSSAPALMPAERRVLLLLAAVQFVNIVDFMMVMPLGPDFARELGIAPDKLGLIGGSYTAAAAVAGVLGSTFLDRFDRRNALLLANLGLALGTAAAALAEGLGGLLAARVLAGLFGGPATALTYAVVADLIPPERRGRAMGVVMGAFSIASVLGVPAGLELARMGGWRAPFLVVAAAGLAVGLLSRALLPPMRGHLDRGAPAGPLSELLGRPLVLGALALNFSGLLARFSLIPFISAFVVLNLGLPREDLGGLYMLGGLASLLTLRVVGPMVDRVGMMRVYWAATVALTATTGLAFLIEPPILPPTLLFPLFMASTSGANVALQTLFAAVPRPPERARYQSAQSAVQHLGAAAGASLGTLLLDGADPTRLEGVPRIALFSMAVTLLLPLGAAWVQGRLRAAPAPAAPLG